MEPGQLERGGEAPAIRPNSSIFLRLRPFQISCNMLRSREKDLPTLEKSVIDPFLFDSANAMILVASTASTSLDMAGP